MCYCTNLTLVNISNKINVGKLFLYGCTQIHKINGKYAKNIENQETPYLYDYVDYLFRLAVFL